MIKKLLPITLAAGFIITNVSSTTAMEPEKPQSKASEEDSNLSQKEKDRLIFNRMAMKKAAEEHRNQTGEHIPEDVISGIGQHEYALTQNNTFKCPTEKEIMKAFKERTNPIVQSPHGGYEYQDFEDFKINGIKFKSSGSKFIGDVKSIELINITQPAMPYMSTEGKLTESTGDCEYYIVSAKINSSDYTRHIITIYPKIDKTKYYIDSNLGRLKLYDVHSPLKVLRIGKDIKSGDDVIFKIVEKPAKSDLEEGNK